MKPTIGRIVHYKRAGLNQTWPAIITAVHSDTNIALTAWPPMGAPWMQSDVPHSPTPADECWWWPPREGG